MSLTSYQTAPPRNLCVQEDSGSGGKRNPKTRKKKSAGGGRGILTQVEGFSTQVEAAGGWGGGVAAAGGKSQHIGE